MATSKMDCFWVVFFSISVVVVWGYTTCPDAGACRCTRYLVSCQDAVVLPGVLSRTGYPLYEYPVRAAQLTAGAYTLEGLTRFVQTFVQSLQRVDFLVLPERLGCMDIAAFQQRFPNIRMTTPTCEVSHYLLRNKINKNNNNNDKKLSHL